MCQIVRIASACACTQAHVVRARGSARCEQRSALNTGAHPGVEVAIYIYVNASFVQARQTLQNRSSEYIMYMDLVLAPVLATLNASSSTSTDTARRAGAQGYSLKLTCGQGHTPSSKMVEECMECGEGTYKEKSDNSSCVKCPEYSSTSRTAAIAMQACVCSSGYSSRLLTSDAAATFTNTPIDPTPASAVNTVSASPATGFACHPRGYVPPEPIKVASSVLSVSIVAIITAQITISVAVSVSSAIAGAEAGTACSLLLSIVFPQFASCHLPFAFCSLHVNIADAT